MYQKNLTCSLTIRLTEEQKEFVEIVSKELQIKPSDYVRILINHALYNFNKNVVLGDGD